MKGLVVIVLALLLAVVGMWWLRMPQAEPEPAEVADAPPPVVATAGTQPVARQVVQPAPVDAPRVPAPVVNAPQVAKAPAATVPQPVVDAAPPVVQPPDPVRMLAGRDQAEREVLDADLEQAIANNGWVDYQKLLERSLLASIESLPRGPELDPYAPAWDDGPFYQVLLRWHVLKALPPSAWVAASDSSACAGLARWLFHDNRAMEQVVMTVTGQDDAAKVLAMMVELWGIHIDDPAMARKYFHLSLACAVVFDRQLAYKEPSGTDGYHVDAVRRFQWYVEKNEKGWLEVSIDRSSARDLVFVVCAPVSEAELDWAVRKFRSLRRDGWGKTYGAVKYLMERAVEGLNPYAAYKLEEILEEGGICGDQTYFCVNTARAAGIPSLGLSGVTSAGGHAWAAVKLQPDEWSTMIGRIGGVSMGKGEDPQTGQTITEQDIWVWSSRDHQSEALVLKVHRHLWLADLLRPHGRDPEVAAAVGSAFRVGKAFPVVWDYVYQVMLADPELKDAPEAAATVQRWDEFAKEIKREFQDNPRMGGLAVRVEDQHVFPYQPLEDVRRSLMRDRRRHGRNAAEQSDLVVSTLKREADILLAKDPEHASREICQLYDNALKDYGGSITGFQAMTEDYFRLMRGDASLAGKAMRDIELAFLRVVDTGSTEFFRGKTEAGILQRICAMYRELGDEKRAKLLQGRFERQLEKGKRGAL